MRILTLSYEFPPIGGGGSRVVHGLGRELVELGHEVDVVTMGFGDLPRRERADGMYVHRVRSFRSSGSICHPREMIPYIAAALPVAARLTRERNYDINHTHFILPDGLIAYGLRKLTGLPYVLTAHGSDVAGYNPDRFKIHHRFLGPLWRTVVRGSKQLVCPSDSLQALVRMRRPGVPSVLVPNGTRTTRFDPGAPKRDRILIVTRMLPRKGVQHLIRALPGMDLDYDVHIVGDGPHLPALKRLAAELDVEVTFHGWLDNGSPELKRLYESSRIFVFPSEAENFPIVLLEAMAAGLAIITTEGTGCAEVVGDAGVLVKPGSVAEVRHALAALVADPVRCRRLGRAARRRLEENFTWEVVARRYLNVYGQSSPAEPGRLETERDAARVA